VLGLQPLPWQLRQHSYLIDMPTMTTNPSANVLSARDLQFREQTSNKPVWETQHVECKMLKYAYANFKRSFGGYYHGGTAGLQGAVPHAYKMYQNVDCINNMSKLHKADAFM